MSFVCAECRQLVTNPNDRYEERIEYRRADGGKRPHVRKLRDLCRACMERVWARRSSGEQEALL